MSSLVINKKLTGQMIYSLMEQNHYTVKELQSYLCLESVQSIYQWLNGRNLPSVDHLYLMSQLFHVSINEILIVYPH